MVPILVTYRHRGPFDPPPLDSFSSFEQARRIVETQRLYGAEIYRLVGAPEGTKVKRVAGCARGLGAAAQRVSRYCHDRALASQDVCLAAIEAVRSLSEA